MRVFDDIVVGSGVSGLTMSLLLAMNGRKVLLLEKNPRIGGSLSRFSKKGAPFDTGFHFTGGLQKGGLLYDMLSVLGIRDAIEPVFLSEDNANSFFIESENRTYNVPYGIQRMKDQLKEYFPKESAAIDGYFDRVLDVCEKTPSMNLHSLTANQSHINEDFIALEEVLNGLTDNRSLRAVLCGFAMCYGVRPDEISFANHSRICIGLYESVARVREGGTAFENAFKKKLTEYGVDIACNTHIVELADIHGKKVGRFILSSGEEVTAQNCIFTIHPKEILKVLPQEYLSRAFQDRVSSFESSTGFFSLFALLDEGQEEPNFGETIVSILPHTDITRQLDPPSQGPSALVVIKSREDGGDKKQNVICALEPSSHEHVQQWKDTTVGKRPQAYLDYKQQRIDAMTERIFSVFPNYKGHLHVVDSASVLTFRDYLNNYDGSAYGVKQKLGQYNLRGRLPLHNLHAAGQSALLPGVIGAMMSSFIVARALIPEEQYNGFLRKNVCS
ncbi:MAG TPA: hypothetical protein DCO77_01810 [Nitrospiraceae bacterium]|nr:hypothetical protein [Nitrospiraceae bacterium]